MSTPATIRGPVQSETAVGPVRRRIPTLPAEEELVLLSAGSVANDMAIREIAQGQIDWQRFLGLAQFERAVPVIFPRLRALAGDAIPAGVLDQMRRLAMVSDFAMLHLESRLHDSLRELRNARVRVMLLKGAALAHTVYDGARQRPMSDLDVLVPASDALRARTVMLSTGWREVASGLPKNVYDHHHHLPPLHDTRAPELQLEIHTALFPERQPFAFAVNELWARAIPLGDDLHGAFAPDPIHSLLHACLHFVWSHQAHFGVWRTIRDVDAITRTGMLDWDAFVHAAQAVRGVTSCYWTLRIAEMTAGVSVPALVLERLRPPRGDYMLKAMERHFVRNLFPVELGCPSVTLDQTLWELAIMPKWSGHGDVRPWEGGDDFVVPRSTQLEPAPNKHRSHIRASLRYLAMLLRR